VGEKFPCFQNKHFPEHGRASKTKKSRSDLNILVPTALENPGNTDHLGHPGRKSRTLMELVSNPQNFIDFISQPWHWSVSGAAIAAVLFLLTWMGRSFGMSTTFKGACAVAGAGKKIPFFNMNLKEEYWRFAFAFGGIVGGFIAVTFLRSPEPVAISQSTVEYLASQGMNYPEVDGKGMGFVPTELFNFGNIKGLLMAIAGGFLVGFGARYGDGCTSGHAISGLAHLQLPSLITVIGFFIGGLSMAHFILPWLLG